jgi:dihydroorotase
MILGMQDGTIDIIASDHAPHDSDSKEQSVSCASFGIIGLETMLPLSLELYHKGLLSLERILEMLTINPAKLINEENRGSIEIGKIADLAIIDLNFEWTIDSSKMMSKSKNTPFNGRKVKGKNMMTIAGGEIVYCDENCKL